MKSFSAFILALILSFSLTALASAQSAESIWLVANTTAYKTGETIIVTVNASTAVPIQGFTFQIRYDPNCLQPVQAVSPISGMNGLSLPQSAGLVDATFASTAPRNVNGILAEVRFTALAGCQTSLTLESAALAVKNASGFAAPLPGVTIGANNIALNIDPTVGSAQAPQTVSGSSLSLSVQSPKSHQALPAWAIVLFAAILVAGVMFGAFKLFLGHSPKSIRQASVQFKHGPYAGKSFTLNKLPCLIGRDANNDICINDPYVSRQHIKIFAADNSYYLQDLGGETYLNGRAIKQSSAVLKAGDVIRLGKSALFTFGA